MSDETPEELLGRGRIFVLIYYLGGPTFGQGVLGLDTITNPIMFASNHRSRIRRKWEWSTSVRSW